MEFFQAPNHRKTIFKSCLRAVVMTLSTSAKSYLPSLGSTNSQYAGTKTELTPLFFICFNAFLMSPKPFHATEACIGCKKCEKVCPVGNITVTDRPVWGGNCTQCLACYHVCPVHAVEYGKMTGKKGQYKGRLLKDL